jgi:uncharacterized membrane protein YdfJ with MMPL/SSD domain
LPVSRRARRARDERRGRDGRRLFASFAPSTQQGLKRLAVGLASAILIDPTLVRAVLLPTTRGLLGKAQPAPSQAAALPAEARARARGRPARA